VQGSHPVGVFGREDLRDGARGLGPSPTSPCPSAPARTGLCNWAAGIGTGLELHPGGQKRVSVTAALVIMGQDSIDLVNGKQSGSGSVMFQLTVTANRLHP
jgi:hypothetical protein